MDGAKVLVVWCCAALSVLAATSLGAAPQPQDERIQVTTRLVKRFGGLEQELIDAAGRKDAEAVGRYVTDDFELRTAAAPGRPVPKADWLRAELSAATRPTVIREMAARDAGGPVIVSFSLSGASTDAPLAAGGLFIVDLWVDSGGMWKIAARFTSPMPHQ